MNPGEFFTWAELARSGVATARGIRNEPDELQRANLHRLCLDALDPIRRAVGGPVRVTSGFRSRALNDLLKGAASSAHMRGLAADIKAEGLEAPDLARICAEVVADYDQIIWYDPERGGHVHVGLSTQPKGRRQLLHAPLAGGYRPWTP